MRAAAVAAVVLALGACAAPASEWVRLTPGTPWQLEIGSDAPPADPGARAYDVDYQLSPAAFAALREGGEASIVCYVSLGTWEEWRDDAGDLPADVIGDPLPEWPGENYVDLRRLDALVPWWEARLDAARDAGCDAVDPDNLDAYQNASGFDLTEDDAVAAFSAFAELAHDRGMAVGQKNAPDLVPALVGVADFAVVEECVEQGFCEAFAPYVQEGKAVFAVEYPDGWEPGDSVQAVERGAEWCEQAGELGLSLLISERSLGAPGSRCSQGGTPPTV